MKLIVLGSGASIAMPRPFCSCRNCSKARKMGSPYARTGPALFLEEESILFDTPEEIRFQIEKERIKKIRHVFYTHWHPDHTWGMRIFEHINFSYPDGEPRKEAINVYIPENALPDFEKLFPLSFYEKVGYIKINKIKDRTQIKIGKARITPLDFRRKDRVRYGYLVEQDGKRVLYAPCSIYGAVLDENYYKLDLLFMEAGWHGDTALRQKLLKGHAWQSHISFEENLALVRKLKPKRAILTHIEGARHLKSEANHDFLLGLARKHKKLNIDIAYDCMKIKL